MEGNNLQLRVATPAITDSTPLGTSTSPGLATSDVASGSAHSLQDARNPRRSVIGSSLRDSASNTPHEKIEANAIDPLSQQYTVIIPATDLWFARLDYRKGVSFLSRIIGTKKKDQPIDTDDETSEPEAHRMSVDTSHPIGFIPRHPPPAKYLKVRAHYKKDKTFNRVFLAQDLEGSGPSPNPVDRRISTSSALQNGDHTGKAVWALTFSKDGKYLAAAGQDRKVRVWAVIATPDEREDANGDEESTPVDAQDQSGLRAPVFQPEPVQVYEGHTGSILDLSWSKHSDFVTSIQFHPRDDRFFLAGSLDTKLRLWSIPDKSVAFATAVPDMITAVAFTPDGRYSIAGCLNGMLNVYDTEGLKVSAQIHVRSARGRNSKGSKITGIDTMTVPRDDAKDETDNDIRLLVTSNDSRIRLYDFHSRSLLAKFRGNENTCSQIRATFTNDGKYIICGSEDRRAYVWPVGSVQRDSEKQPVEVFETQSAIVTAAIMAPIQTKQVLALSEDPIYDICNPPPVALMGPDPTGPGKENGKSHKRSTSAPRLSIVSKMAHDSPLYLTRSKHPGGEIIVIADYSGKIKVLRQDCAYQKRRYENWDTNSTISRRILGRSNSARRSATSSTGKESTHKTPSERIVSWRNSVVRHARSSTEGSRSGLQTRSPSPQSRPATIRLASSRPSSVGPHESVSIVTTSPPPSPHLQGGDMARTNETNNGRANAPKPASSTDLLASNKAPDNPLWLQGDRSYAYWNKITHDALAMQSRNSNDFLKPDRIPSRGMSDGTSVLSSDYSNSTGDAEEDVLKCDSCHGTSFRRVKGRDGKQKLICSECHRPVS
ncbi:Oxo-4-hydroxy-4-carboxy-5-ureidoimidazoline decarboxylase [Penicillium coprophilum]|uniref:Oxo-4-hydroxy-4-carboxy-5-ureidoimidazoline decarboxylase n=1 Tax=Penicillium coprophilum TaxID=36646 RepID=UPI002395A703|nr:Oxo-4-hydroxy-4-carboxy-5-ureidoimidazoline decarboxylase [Penicillium coprophilum]KAJ5177831.1 Oxo-4-hydroxy-4-carboxy-5-ureidoimidazoline decarboxylase [Penicillium coprophilum]